MGAIQFFRRGGGDQVGDEGMDERRRRRSEPGGRDQLGRSEPGGRDQLAHTLVGKWRQRPWPIGAPGATTLILIDPDDHGSISVRSNRGWSRFLARVFASSLDDQLARGRSPESGPLLAARAQMLVSPQTRRALAHGFENVIATARRTSTGRGPRAPLDRRSIVACEPDIREMREALLTPLPTPARGPAMASRLLTDGTGPLFDRHRSPELRTRLREVIAQLDPSLSL